MGTKEFQPQRPEIPRYHTRISRRPASSQSAQPTQLAPPIPRRSRFVQCHNVTSSARNSATHSDPVSDWRGWTRWACGPVGLCVSRTPLTARSIMPTESTRQSAPTGEWLKQIHYSPAPHRRRESVRPGTIDWDGRGNEAPWRLGGSSPGHATAIRRFRSSNSQSRLLRDQRSTTESTEIHGKGNPNQLPLPLSVSFPGATPARRVGSFRGCAFVMIFLAGVISRCFGTMPKTGLSLRFEMKRGASVRPERLGGSNRGYASRELNVVQRRRVV